MDQYFNKPITKIFTVADIHWVKAISIFDSLKLWCFHVFFIILFSIEWIFKKNISALIIAPIFHFETQTTFVCNLLYFSQCSSVHCDYFSNLFIENLHIYFLVHLYEHLHDPSKENFAGFAVFVCEHCSNFGSFFYLCFNFNLTAVDI